MIGKRTPLTTSPIPAIVAVLVLAGGAVTAGHGAAAPHRSGAARAVTAAPSETLIRSFGRASRNPTSGLVADAAGNLYGEASSGSGIVFELSPRASPGGAWTETIVHRFFGGFDGCSPSGGLIFDTAGNLYGTAGCGLANGGGIVFRLARPMAPKGRWTETVLYAFLPTHNTIGDGEGPRGRLAFDKHGNLYGVTYAGGSHGFGTVYMLAPPTKPGNPWTETLIYNFVGLKQRWVGYIPDHGVTIDDTGALYGTTTSGGSLGPACGGNCGTAFRLTPSLVSRTWTYDTIYAFNGTDGYQPECELIFDRAGNLYGTTEYGSTGGGVAFQLSPPAQGHAWHETVLYNFPQYKGDSAYPQTGLVFDAGGNLYGTSQYGGSGADGTVFRLTPPSQPGGAWTESILHAFAGGADGSYPAGALIFGADGKLYGTTGHGGVGRCPGGDYRGCGTAFAIVP
jgi:uncharacterized repeat protein (TIGR03803 family)